MLTLIVPIEYYNLDPKGRVDYYGGKKYEDAILTLKSIPEMSQDENKPTFGRWMSTSIFLGKEVEGNYYVTRIKAWDDRRYPMKGVRDPRIKNPIGKFFDSFQNFLILYEFAPNEMQTTSGFGFLGKRREGVWGGVNWRNANTTRPR